MSKVLSGGLVAGLTDIAKDAVISAYNEVKRILTEKSGSESAALIALRALEAQPTSQGRQQTLIEELEAANLIANKDVDFAAQKFVRVTNELTNLQTTSKQFAHGTGIAQASLGGSASVVINSLPLSEHE